VGIVTEGGGGPERPEEAAEAPGGPGEARGQPSEEEVRAALEEQMRKVRVEDLIMQSVASLINLTARRIAKEDERDLQQASIGIEAVRALSGLLPEEASKQVRQALSELQVLYAREAGEGAEQGAEKPPSEGPTGPAGGEQPPSGGGDRPSGLWTPRGST
jgi:hypothetical protein